MLKYLLDLPLAVTGFIVILISVVGALFALSMFHRVVDAESLRKNHDVAGFIYAVITVAYAVILAFVVIVVWENFNSAEKVCQEEANGIGDLTRLAIVFPPPIRHAIDSLTLSYMQGVVTKEWNAMAKGEEDEEVRDRIIALWNVYYSYIPETWQQQQFYTTSLQKIVEINDKRRLRILDSRSSLPVIMWVLLLGGGFLSVGFSFLFSAPVNWVQMVMTGALAAMFTLVLFLIFALDHPFSGDVRVQPESYQHLIEHAMGKYGR